MATPTSLQPLANGVRQIWDMNYIFAQAAPFIAVGYLHISTPFAKRALNVGVPKDQMHVGPQYIERQL
jgi:hypothetical protein